MNQLAEAAAASISSFKRPASSLETEGETTCTDSESDNSSEMHLPASPSPPLKRRKRLTLETHTLDPIVCSVSEQFVRPYDTTIRPLEYQPQLLEFPVRLVWDQTTSSTRIVVKDLLCVAQKREKSHRRLYWNFLPAERSYARVRCGLKDHDGLETLLVCTVADAQRLALHLNRRNPEASNAVYAILHEIERRAECTKLQVQDTIPPSEESKEPAVPCVEVSKPASSAAVVPPMATAPPATASTVVGPTIEQLSAQVQQQANHIDCLFQGLMATQQQLYATQQQVHMLMYPPMMNMNPMMPPVAPAPAPYPYAYMPSIPVARMQ